MGILRHIQTEQVSLKSSKVLEGERIQLKNLTASSIETRNQNQRYFPHIQTDRKHYKD